MSDQPVLLEVSGAVATITLNRPERLNAFSIDLGEHFIEAVRTLEGRDDVRVVVLTGAGRGFCAGGDLEAGLGAMVGPPPYDEQVARFSEYTAVMLALRDLAQVTVAAINGPCAGAGLSFALACDLRVAAASAKFATAFLTAGVSGDFGGAWFATRLLGAARAAELYLLNERFDAAEAHRIGLVSKVLPDDGFRAGVEALVASLVARAPQALALGRANLRDAEVLDLPAYLARENERQVTTMTSEDAAEAAVAFLTKRPPVFTGR